MHCREILFTPHCTPRAREFPQSAQLFCTTYGCGATGRQTCPIFGFLPIFQYTSYTYWCGPTLQRDVVLEWCYSVTVETALSELHDLYRVPLNFLKDMNALPYTIPTMSVYRRHHLYWQYKDKPMFYWFEWSKFEFSRL